MIDRFRTRFAKLIVDHLRRPRSPDIEIWLSRAATTDDPERKRRYLNMVLYLDPDNERASLALEDLPEPVLTPELLSELSESLFAPEFAECVDAAQTIIHLEPHLSLQDEMVARLVCRLVKLLSHLTPVPVDLTPHISTCRDPHREPQYRDLYSSVLDALVGPDLSLEDAILEVLSHSPASAKEGAVLTLLRGHLSTHRARPVLHSALEQATDERLAFVLRFALAILFREDPDSVLRDLVQFRTARPVELDSWDDQQLDFYLQQLNRYVSAETAARCFCQLADKGRTGTALRLPLPVLSSVARSCSHDAWVRMTETAWSQFLQVTNKTHLAHLSPIHNPSQVRLVLQEQPPLPHYLPNLPPARGRIRLTQDLWGPVLTVLMDARIPRE
jgi:hypothetical protein